MLPDIETDHRGHAVAERRVLVGGGVYLQFAVLQAQPRPAAAETFGRGIGEVFLEAIDRTKGLDDTLAQRAAGCPAAGCEQRPEETVVHVAAGVVADTGADRLRHAGEVADQCAGSAREQIRMPLEQFLRIVDVGLVMLRVVNLHRLRVDVRLERIIGESQLGQVPSEGGSGGRGVGCGGLGQAEAGDHRAGTENFQRLAAGHGGIIAIIHA